MRILALLLSLLSLPTFGQTFGQTAAFRGASIAKQTSASGWVETGYPTNIPGFPATAWYNPNAVLTNTSGQVTNWPDASANGFTLYQATASKAPYATNIVNGQITLKFDGVDDVLSSFAFSMFGTNQEVVMVYYYWNQYNNYYHYFLSGTNTVGTFTRILLDDSSNIRPGDSSASLSYNLITNIWVILNVVRNGSGATYYTFTNSIVAASGGAIGDLYNTTWQGLNVGDRPGLSWSPPIYLSELIFYPTNLGSPTAYWSTQRSNLFYYITNKYGLSIP